MLKKLVECVSRMKSGSVVILAVISGGCYTVIRRISSASQDNQADNEIPCPVYLPFEKAEHSERIFPFKILQLAKSKNRKVRHKAVRALTLIPRLDKSQYQMIAQTCDLQTAVGLARTYGARPEFFLMPPFLHLSPREVFEDEFRSLLNVFPSNESCLCAQYFINYADDRLRYHSSKTDESTCDSIGEMNYSLYYNKRHPPPSAPFMKLYLEALLVQSTIPLHRYLMVKNGILMLFHQVRLRYEGDEDIKSLIGQILGNVALEEHLHTQMFQAGWVGILASWMNSSYIQVSLPAIKTLANMDKDYDSVRFEDGIYLLHPQCREQESKINADIVFVHGIMGGAFRTWRQHDAQKLDIKGNSVANVTSGESLTAPETVENSAYTFCWPKDWLAKDFPEIRFISVDYASHFSEWKTKCPVNKEKRYLKTRAKDTLQKLIAAGIGDKPVIWVSHSMGGLIVKQMLVDAQMSEETKMNSVAHNTIGVVFYSVPHQGSQVANLKPSAEMFLQPSIEAQLMKKGSPELLKLHEDFKDIVTKQNIKTLSFGETLKSKLGFHWNSILVPKDSADPGFGDFYELPIDHLSICKPQTPDSDNYKLLLKFLYDVLPKSTITPQQAWFGKIPEICIISSLIH